MKRIISYFILCFLLLVLANANAKTLTFPHKLKSIDSNAFYGNKSVKEAILPNGVKYIGAYAFANSNLQKIYLPQSINYIASTAFDNISNLTVFGTSNTYAEQYCDKHSITFVDPDKVGQEYYVTFYDENNSIITHTRYNYGEPLIAPHSSAFVQRTYLNEVYGKYFNGWKENNIIVQLPKYVRRNQTYHASYIIKEIPYTQHIFTSRLSYSAQVPSDWTSTQTTINYDTVVKYTCGDFSVTFGYNDMYKKIGSSTDYINRFNSRLDNYTTKGTETVNGITYKYGISVDASSKYSKRIQLFVNSYDSSTPKEHIFIEASGMTESQLQWFNYIVSTLSNEAIH